MHGTVKEGGVPLGDVTIAARGSRRFSLGFPLVFFGVLVFR